LNVKVGAALSTIYMVQLNISRLQGRNGRTVVGWQAAVADVTSNLIVIPSTGQVNTL
jgi:hypothetical protein